MAGPITWRNVEQTSPLAGAALMRTAMDGINNGFGAFNKVLENEKTTRLDNWDQTKTNNTQAFLDKLAQYKTPEALQAAQARGELDPLRQGFGAQIDQAAVRDADNKMLDTLRQRATDGYNYDKTRTAQQDDPVLQRLGAELLAVNPENLKDINGAFGGLEAQANQLVIDGKLSAAGRLAFLKDLDVRRENRETDLQGDITFGNQQASHGVTMQNHANQQLVFSQGQEDRNEGIALDTAVRDTFRRIQENEANTWDGIKQFATEAGVPLDSRGYPDLDKATPVQRQQYQTALEQSGVGKGLTQTEQINAALMEVGSRGDLTVSPQQLASFKSDLTGLMSQTNQLAPEDAAVLESSVAAENEAATIKLKDIEARHAKEQAANPFAAGPFNAEDAVVDAMTALPKDFDPMGVNSSQKENLSKTVYRAIQDGVPPAIAKMVVSQVGDSWAVTDDIDDWFIKETQKLVDSPQYGAKFKEAQELRKTQQNELNEVKEKTLANISKLTGSARKNAGLAPGQSGNYLKALKSYNKEKEKEKK